MKNEIEKVLIERLWDTLGNNLEEGLRERSGDEIVQDFLDAGVDIRPDLEAIAQFDSLPSEELQKLSEADFRSPMRHSRTPPTERLLPSDANPTADREDVPLFLLGSVGNFKTLQSSSVYMDGDSERGERVFALDFESVLQPAQFAMLPKWVGESLRIVRVSSNDGHVYCAQVELRDDEQSPSANIRVILMSKDGSSSNVLLTPERPVRIFPSANIPSGLSDIHVSVRIEPQEDAAR